MTPGQLPVQTEPPRAGLAHLPHLPLLTPPPLVIRVPVLPDALAPVFPSALLLHAELPADAGLPLRAGQGPLPGEQIMVTPDLTEGSLRGRGRNLGETPGLRHGLVMLHVTAVTRLGEVLVRKNSVRLNKQ